MVLLYWTLLSFPRKSLAAAGVVVFCLIGGVVTYLIVNGGGAVEEAVVDDEAPIEGDTQARADTWLGRG